MAAEVEHIQSELKDQGYEKFSGDSDIHEDMVTKIVSYLRREASIQ